MFESSGGKAMAAVEIKKRLFEGFSSLNQLKHVHARLLRFGLDQDNYLINTLLKLTFNFDNLNYSQLLFNQCKEPNIFVWNTMIRGLVFRDCFQKSIDFFYMMRENNFLPNNFTFPFVLKSCARQLDLRLGMKLHTLVIKVGFEYDVFVKTGLVGLYSKCGCLGDAHKVFDEIPEKNVVSWTAIICGYIGTGQFSEAIDMFKSMLGMNLRPDSFTLVRVVSACAQLGDLRVGEWVHRCVVDIGMSRNIFVGTALVDMYAKCGKMESARVAFDEIHEKDLVTWGAMIQGYASNGHPKEALNLFNVMQKEKLKLDSYTMVGVLSACASLGALELGESASSLIDTNEFFSNPVLGTALIDTYAKCGKMASAWGVFKQMSEKDLVVWNAIITGLAMSGHVKAAFALFGQLEKFGIQPDGNTFIGLLCGCTHAGLVDDGRRLFSNMSRIFSLPPTIEHYGCMVDLLGRAGLLDEAHNLIKSMPMEANAIVWGALLGGCRLHRDTQLAEHVLKRLIELEPWNSGNYVLLSNILSANHKWEDAQMIRSKMSAKHIQKTPGYSWIEVEGTVHEFLVGDKSHPLSSNIYAKLSELTKKMKETGYIPTTEVVLFDIEDEEKEHFVGCHSEKLAIAFGLITTKPNEVIRIVKNLRVCGDCHMAIKLMSKITGREIVVRDTNRFHCFVDGSCSCNDYW